MNIRDFFALNDKMIPIQNPINRNAFSQDDVEYKLKWIKTMNDIGMKITIDEAANICGTMSGKIPNKSIVGISHTDSVDNGGQFDGVLGIYSAMQTAEDIKKNGKENLVHYKVIIAMCEESTVMSGNACVGSKYLRGDNIDFDQMKSRNGKSLREEVTNFKKALFTRLDEEGLTGVVREVDRVVESDEIITAIEGHIEQANVLKDCKHSIGICTSIASPYRMKANTEDIRTGAKFICHLNDVAKHDPTQQTYRATIPKFSIKQEVDESVLKDKQLLTVRFIGEKNHSGATPMNQRKDAVYGAAKFINLLADNPDIEFLETYTKQYGPNQITDICDVKFAINSDASKESILNYWFSQKDARELANVSIEYVDEIPDHDNDPGLFIDIRQQVGMNPKLTADMIWETIKDIIHKTGCTMSMQVVSKGKPYQTTPELVDNATDICKSNGIMYKQMPSWAGHDLATLTNNPDARTLLLFCQSEGGSHNPKETTNLDSIEKLILVQSTLTQQELERANQLFCGELDNHSIIEDSR